MNVATLTVVTKKGIRYAASVVTPTFEDYTMKAQLSFVCSGRQHVIPAEEVKGVEFYFQPDLHGLCNHCDQHLPGNVFQG